MEKNAHAAACFGPRLHVRNGCLWHILICRSDFHSNRDVRYPSCLWHPGTYPGPVQQILDEVICDCGPLGIIARMPDEKARLLKSLAPVAASQPDRTIAMQSIADEIRASGN